MEPQCDFCGIMRAVVYCKSDCARLCLQCDGCVHNANALSRRHLRSLLCDKCNLQPAIVRCMDDKVSLCQNCGWNGNDCVSIGRRQPLECYAGCPSLAEFSKIWSSVLDSSSSSGFGSGFESIGTQSVNEHSISNFVEPRDNGGSLGMVAAKLIEPESCLKFEPWMASSIIQPNPSYITYCRDQAPLFPEESKLTKVLFSLSYHCLTKYEFVNKWHHSFLNQL